MMQRVSMTAMRLALVASALALLAAGGSPPAAFAQETPDAEVERAPGAESEQGFLPPMFGAPKQRVGAGSRFLGPSRTECPEVASGEVEDDGDGEAGDAADCAGEAHSEPGAGKEAETTDTGAQ